MLLPCIHKSLAVGFCWGWVRVLGMVSWAIAGGNFPGTGSAVKCKQTVTTPGGRAQGY